jgi:protein N-terminal methyltransferase
MGLQEFKFVKKYDIVWVQWVLCYLTDEDMVRFLKEAKENLVSQEHSMIFLKENVTDGELPVFDESDNSMVRSRQAFEDIYA